MIEGRDLEVLMTENAALQADLKDTIEIVNSLRKENDQYKQNFENVSKINSFQCLSTKFFKA